MVTTIKLQESTKKSLDQFREYRNESYDDVVKKVLYVAKNANNELSKNTLKAIKDARKRMKQGNFLSEDEAKRRLGL